MLVYRCHLEARLHPRSVEMIKIIFGGARPWLSTIYTTQRHLRQLRTEKHCRWRKTFCYIILWWLRTPNKSLDTSIMVIKAKYGTIICEIHHRATMFNCVFSFEGRESNREAHSIAKFSYFLGQGRHVWLGQPHDLRCIPVSGVLINKTWFIPQKENFERTFTLF